MTSHQRALLGQARRWAGSIARAHTRPDKRRAARKCCDCLVVLLGGRAKSEIERR